MTRYSTSLYCELVTCVKAMFEGNIEQPYLTGRVMKVHEQFPVLPRLRPQYRYLVGFRREDLIHCAYHSAR